jgi:hypothetical protein
VQPFTFLSLAMKSQYLTTNIGLAYISTQFKIGKKMPIFLCLQHVTEGGGTDNITNMILGVFINKCG